VEARQRERGRRVIKRRRSPIRRRVADRAIRGEAGRHVSGILRSGEIRLMARVTRRRR